MFDPNLTREIATAELRSGGPAIAATARVENSLIHTIRDANDFRNITFASKENYERQKQELQARMRNLSREIVQSEIFQCLKQNFGIYAFSHPSLREQLSMPIAQTLSSFLLESVDNAAMHSNTVDVHTSIGPNGILLDVDQGVASFDSSLLATIRQRSHEIHVLLQGGQTLAQILVKTQADCRRLIGYNPPNHDNHFEASPFRGNGIGNMLTNDFVRTNFLLDAEHNSTLCLHTTRQLQNALLFKLGNIAVVNDLYGPTAPRVESNIVDDVFADWK